MSTPSLPRIAHDKLSQEVAEAIRWRIINGSLPHGQRLTEESISDETGVSRGTVREAIRELAGEGLVSVESYRGAVVSGVSLEELAKVFIPVRWTLEKFAVTQALDRLSEDDFAQLLLVVEAMEKSAKTSEPDSIMRMVELDIQFHRTIIDAAGSNQTQQLWQAIQPRVRLGFYRLSTSQSHPSLIADEHRRLLELLRGGKIDAVLDELEEHIVHSPMVLLGLGKADKSAAARNASVNTVKDEVQR